MLFNIDDRVGPDLLHVLASMGHGDCIVVADRNFPAASTARSCTSRRLLRMDVPTTADAVGIIAKLIPLEEGKNASCHRMCIDGAPDELPPVTAEVVDAIASRQSGAGPVTGLERNAFYAAAKSCFAVLLTRERRFYGSIILRKGVIHPG